MRQVTHSAESQQPGTDRLPSSIRRVCLFGPVPCKDMGNSLLLRSGHLDIKDTQCAETKDVLKKSYNITSRFRVMGVQKIQKDAQKIKFSPKVIYYINSFFFFVRTQLVFEI